MVEKVNILLQINLASADLCAVLASVPPAQLKGLALLKGQRLLPTDIPRETLREAVLELIQYTDSCNKALDRLRDVEPVPLDFSILEWSL